MTRARGLKSIASHGSNTTYTMQYRRFQMEFPGRHCYQNQNKRQRRWLPQQQKRQELSPFTRNSENLLQGSQVPPFISRRSLTGGSSPTFVRRDEVGRPCD